VNEAEKWVRENSRANGSGRSLMFALARFANGCLVICRAHDLEREARISRPQLYRWLSRLEDLGELQRLMEHHEKKSFRRYHLTGFCKSHSLNAKCAVSYRKQGQVSDLRRTSLIVSSLLPFPCTVFTPDDCEQCRGTGYRDFTIITHDGTPQRVAIPCAHEIAAIAGRWKPVETWQDELLSHMPQFAASERQAEQLTLAEFKVQQRREELRQQQQKILQEYGETPKPAEAALPENVIVMRRKTA